MNLNSNLKNKAQSLSTDALEYIESRNSGLFEVIQAIREGYDLYDIAREMNTDEKNLRRRILKVFKRAKKHAETCTMDMSSDDTLETEYRCAIIHTACCDEPETSFRFDQATLCFYISEFKHCYDGLELGAYLLKSKKARHAFRLIQAAQRNEHPIASYVKTVLDSSKDAFIFIEETKRSYTTALYIEGVKYER